MDCDVNTTVQLSKIIAPNSGEPFVVETKTTTTTTTTTVTKRICVGKDANVDLSEIQMLLDGDDDNKLTTNHAATAAIVDAVPPKLNVTTSTKNNKSKQQNVTVVDKSNKRDKSKVKHTKRNSTAKRLSDEQNRSPFLSSTKIENSLKSSPPNRSQDSLKQQKTATEIICSPNLSKISANSTKSSSSKNKINRNKNRSKANDKQSTPTDKPSTKQIKKKRIKPAAARKKTTAGKMGDATPPPKDTRSLRSKSVENQDPNYIDDLISKYIALDKKPSTRRKKKVTARVDKPPPAPVAPQPPVAMPQPPPVDLPDLSAIFESSTEGEAAAAAAANDTAGSSSSFQTPGNVSPASLTEYDDYQLPISSSTQLSNSTPNEALPVADTDDEVAMPLKEHTKSNRAKRKLLPDTADEKAAHSNDHDDDDHSKRSRKIVHKEPPTSKRATATKSKPTQSVECDSTTTTAASAINDSTRTNVCYSPIKLYSPSNRARLRTIANNKLVLTKRSMAKKLQNLSTPSRNTILDRFDASHPMTIEASSRLILYPNDDGGNGAGNNDVSKRDNDAENAPVASNEAGMDFFMRLKQKQRWLLVKEIDCTKDV